MIPNIVHHSYINTHEYTKDKHHVHDNNGGQQTICQNATNIPLQRHYAEMPYVFLVRVLFVSLLFCPHDNLSTPAPIVFKIMSVINDDHGKIPSIIPTLFKGEGGVFVKKNTKLQITSTLCSCYCIMYAVKHCAHRGLLHVTCSA